MQNATQALAQDAAVLDMLMASVQVDRTDEEKEQDEAIYSGLVEQELRRLLKQQLTVRQ